MLIIFTGNGKGKTTAALGQAVRALGQDKRVLMIQFIKGPEGKPSASYGVKNWETGEEKFFKNYKLQTIPLRGISRRETNYKLVKAGKGFVKILGDKLPFSEHKKAAQKALKMARVAINPPAGGKKWDLIILDEINVAVNLKLINASDILKIIKNASSDIILTGRNAPKSFIKAADLVTEMKEIKHPFKKGGIAKKGIEY